MQYINIVLTTVYFTAVFRLAAFVSVARES